MDRVYAMSLNECRLIELPKISDPRGSLTFIESGKHIPFEIKRVYYTYDVPGGAERGAHAHRNLKQLLIAISGSFDVVINDGQHTKKFCLNRPFFGLYLCPMIWRSMENFSSGSVCMALASDFYDEEDYFREYPDFLRAARQKENG